MLLQMYQFFVLQRRRSYCFEAKYMLPIQIQYAYFSEVSLPALYLASIQLSIM